MSVHLTREDGIAWVELDRGRGNVLDSTLVEELTEAVAQVGQMEDVRLIAFRGRGRDFCFGASVGEHRRHLAAGMLASFHAFFRALEETGIPTAAAVRGRCLGGGLEVAAWCGRLVCTPDAVLGQPEIKLGVFPPIGSLALQWRVGGAKSLELVLGGQNVLPEEALRIGLVDEVSRDPEAALRTWYGERMGGLSASSLRFAWRAARLPLVRMLRDDLPALEALYLDGLMATHDANEGIAAFLEKRPARYTHR